MSIKIAGGGIRRKFLPKIVKSCLFTIGLLCMTFPATLAHADDTGTGTTDVTIQVEDSDDNITWSAPTQIPFKATAAGTLIGPEPDSIAIRNLSAFSIRVKTMDTAASEPFHLVDDVDKSTTENDLMMTWNGVKAASNVELPDDGTWAMCYVGASDGTDVLPLTYSASKIARVTTDLSSGQRAATISWTVEPTAKAVKQEPQPDKNGVAFAVYSADDSSLDFYKRDRKPDIGDMFNGKIVTEVYDGIEDTSKQKPFSVYGKLTSSVIDKNIKPVTTRFWFSESYTLNYVDILKLNTSEDIDMSYMFYDAYSLENIDLSQLDTSHVKNMSYMFGQSALASLGDISGWNTSNVTNMSNMFANVSFNKFTLLRNWNVSNVTNMSSMFNYCRQLDTLEPFSHWNVSNVIDMSSMFSYSGITSTNYILQWNVANVTNINHMFENCLSLNNEINLSSWNLSHLKSGNGLFNGCTLDKLNLAGWSLTNYAIDSDRFISDSSPCDIVSGVSVNTLNISNWKIPNAKFMSDGIGSCQAKIIKMQNWDFRKFSGFYLSSSNYPSFFNNVLKEIDLSNSIFGDNCDDMFNNFEQLEFADFSQCDFLNTTTMNRMFRNCIKLHIVNGAISWDVSNVKWMTSMFEGCKMLSLDCSNWQADKVSIGEPSGYPRENFNTDAPNVKAPHIWES